MKCQLFCLITKIARQLIETDATTCLHFQVFLTGVEGVDEVVPSRYLQTAYIRNLA